MNPQLHDPDKKLEFGSCHPSPFFHHPYDKYNIKVCSGSFGFAGSSDDRKLSGSGIGGAKKSVKQAQRAPSGTSKGLEERNNLICQAFLTENPFFGAYYPALRPRSADEDGRGSDRSIPLSTDFDDSRTYKVVHSGDSGCNEDEGSPVGSKIKKGDELHHFHEHHHFFHDKDEEKRGIAHYDKYQLRKAKEETSSPFADADLSFFKQPIQESCIVYQMYEDISPRSNSKEMEKEKNKEGGKLLSRSSSRSGRKSSDNETYTVMCGHCQKLLRDYPSARIVGHENVPWRCSNESCDRSCAAHASNYDTKQQKAIWKAANSFVAKPCYQIQRLRVSKTNSLQQNKSKISYDRQDAECTKKSSGPSRSSQALLKSESGGKRKIKGKGAADKKGDSGKGSKNAKNRDSGTADAKCERSSSAVENAPGDAVYPVGSSDSRRKKFTEKKASATKEFYLTRSSMNVFPTSPKSSVFAEKKSSVCKGKKSSSGGNDLKSSSQRISSSKGQIGSCREKGSRASTRSELTRSSTQKPLAMSAAPGRSSSCRESKGSGVVDKRRSSSYSAAADQNLIDKKSSSRSGGRGLTEGAKSCATSSRKGSREPSAKATTSTTKKSKESWAQRTSSMCRGSGVCSDSSRKRKSSSASKAVVKHSSHGDSGKPIKADKTTSFGYNDLMRSTSVTKKKIFSTKSGERTGKTESEVAAKETSRIFETRDRSMQTISNINEIEEGNIPKRSALPPNGITTSAPVTGDSPRSAAAPGILSISKSTSTQEKMFVAPGTAKSYRKTLASKDTGMSELYSIFGPKPGEGLTGIQNELSDLKNQLERLEAMHNLKPEGPVPVVSGTHESIDCPKLPIVVCTSTTYIMTKCSVDCGDKSSQSESPRGPCKIQSQAKFPPVQKEIEVPMAKPRCEYCGEMSGAPKPGGLPEEKPKPKCCFINNYCVDRPGISRAACQLMGARITRAANRICRCPNREILTKYCLGEGRTKSCDRDDRYSQMFGNGKNQTCGRLRDGLLTEDCDTSVGGRRNYQCHFHTNDSEQPKTLQGSSPLNTYSETIVKSQRFAAFQSEGALTEENSCSDGKADCGYEGKLRYVSPEAIPKQNSCKRSLRDGADFYNPLQCNYSLRNSVSDICEYKNSSLIRLLGKSGWIIYTRKLFFDKNICGNGDGVQENGNGDAFPMDFPEFVVYLPKSGVCHYHKSRVTLSQGEHEADESFSRIERKAMSHSSTNLPLTLRTLKGKSAKLAGGCRASGSSVCLVQNARIFNGGGSDIYKDLSLAKERKNEMFEELYLLKCQNAALMGGDCGGDQTFPWPQRSERKTLKRKKHGRHTWQERVSGEREKIPVLFEELKYPHETTRSCRQSSQVSVKYVVAEKVKGLRSNRVIWSMDWCESKGKKKYVFGISRCRKDCSCRGQLSMNDKNGKQRWNQLAVNRRGESTCSTQKPQGDSQQNRCACCSCSPDHTCSLPCEGEEVTGFRKLLKDIGITGFTLGFSRKKPYCRIGYDKSTNGIVGKTTSVKENGEKESSVAPAETGISLGVTQRTEGCECVKQIEQLLNQFEICKTLPLVPGSARYDGLNQAELGQRLPSLEGSAKYEDSLNQAGSGRPISSLAAAAKYDSLKQSAASAKYSSLSQNEVGTPPSSVSASAKYNSLNQSQLEQRPTSIGATVKSDNLNQPELGMSLSSASGTAKHDSLNETGLNKPLSSVEASAKYSNLSQNELGQPLPSVAATTKYSSLNQAELEQRLESVEAPANFDGSLNQVEFGKPPSSVSASGKYDSLNQAGLGKPLSSVPASAKYESLNQTELGKSVSSAAGAAKYSSLSQAVVTEKFSSPTQNELGQALPSAAAAAKYNSLNQGELEKPLSSVPVTAKHNNLNQGEPDKPPSLVAAAAKTDSLNQAEPENPLSWVTATGKYESRNQAGLGKPLPSVPVSVKYDSLNQAGPGRPPFSVPASAKYESTHEVRGNAESRKASAAPAPTKMIVSNADVLDDINLQRQRLNDCENMLKQFEMKLEDVERQGKVLACRCDDITCKCEDITCRCEDVTCKCEDVTCNCVDVACRCEETGCGCEDLTCKCGDVICRCEDTSPSPFDTNMRDEATEYEEPQPTPVQREAPEVPNPISRASEPSELQNQPSKGSTLRDDRLAVSKRKPSISTSLKKSKRSIGCGGSSGQCGKFNSSAQTVATALPVAASLKKFKKSIGCGGSDGECGKFHSAAQTVPKTIMVKNEEQVTSDTLLEGNEYGSERFIRETNMEIQTVNGDSRKKNKPLTQDCSSLPSKIEIYSERKVCTCEKCYNIHYTEKHYLPTTCLKRCYQKGDEESLSYWSTSFKGNIANFNERSEPLTGKVGGGLVDMSRSKKDEATSLSWTEKKDEATSASIKSTKDEATSAMMKSTKDEATSAMMKSKRDEATSAMMKSKRDEATSANRQMTLSRLRREYSPVKSKSRSKRDDYTQISRDRFRSDGDISVFENERFIRQSNLEECSSDRCRGDDGKESDSSEGAEWRGVRHGERDRGKRRCDCGSKIRGIEGRLKALEERKKSYDSSFSSQPRRKHKSEESSNSERKGSTESSSLENIESETDTEVKTRLVNCRNLDFFKGGDPNFPTRCRCAEDAFCPFKNLQGLTRTNNIFLLTNIELLRQWSGVYGCAEYTYTNSFWDVDESAVKPVKIQRDWRQVKTALTSFIRSCRRRKNIFKRRKKDSDGEDSSAGSFASRSTGSSESENSFLDDCSRSSRSLTRQSFHFVAEGARPIRSAKNRRKEACRRSPHNKRRKKSRKRKLQ